MLATSTLVRIVSTQDAVALFAPTFSHAGTEELRVAHLDGDRGLIALRLHRGGGAEGCDFPIRTIAREALALCSRGLLIAHNHPSGDPWPSRDDIAATRALAQAVTVFDIQVYDHLIFARDESRSLLALGLL